MISFLSPEIIILVKNICKSNQLKYNKRNFTKINSLSKIYVIFQCHWDVIQTRLLVLNKIEVDEGQGKVR